MKKFYLLSFSMLCIQLGIGKAQFTDLLNFNQTNGANPYGSLTYSGTGQLFGMTYAGGTGIGNIFSIDTNGTKYKNLNKFNGIICWGPYGSLVLSGTKLYGMTYEGGGYGYGSVFSIDTNGGGLKGLNSFNPGAYPVGSLILSGKVLYGMSSEYGAGEPPCNFGNIFRLDTNGSGYKDLFEFNGTNGWLPRGDLTIIGSRLYGMTQWGGTHALICSNGTFGNIFSIDTNGAGYKDLHDFNDTNGGTPEGNLIVVGNKFYGMTSQGGAHDSGCIFSIDTNGAAYKDLYDFKSITGSIPYGSLVLSGNLLFGTTTIGGAHDSGCIFSIDTNGTGYKDVFDFNGTNGRNPYGNLTVVGNMLYGMTELGGTNYKGVIFGLNEKGAILKAQTLSLNSGEIEIFPNPNNGIFTIQLRTNQIGIMHIVEIYNMLGEKVYTGSLNLPGEGTSNTSISLEGHSCSGVYLYRVITETGDLVSDGKFIIQ